MADPATGEAGSAEAPGIPDALPSPIDSIDDMRAAAKWTLAAAGVVAAALIGGSSLVAVGQVHSTRQALVTGVGLAVALAGIGLAIWSTSKVLAPRLTTPATFRLPELAGLRERIEAEPAEFLGVAATTVDGLFELQGRYRQIAASLAVQAAAAKVPERRAQLEAQLSRVERDAERVGRYVRWLLALGHAWQVKTDLEKSRQWLLVSGVLVVAGAVMFFGATDNSGPAYVPVVTVSPTATTVPAATPLPTATR
jgi:hypothetical protein